MNARAAICKAISAHESALADLRAALAALDGAPEARQAATEWISTKEAMRIMGANSEPTAYRWGRKHGLSKKAPGGRMRFDRAKVEAFAKSRDESGGSFDEDGDSQIAFALR